MSGADSSSRPTRPRLADALACVVDKIDAAGLPGVLAQIDKMGMAGDVRVGAHGVQLPPVFCGWDYLPYDITDPIEAWELLCTRLDLPTWVDDQARRFARADASVEEITAGSCEVLVSNGRDVSRLFAVPSVTPYPPTLAACVAFASDPAGMLTAEAVARQNLGKYNRVVWRTAGRARHAQATESMCSYGGVPTDSHREMCRAMLATGYSIADCTRRDIILSCPDLDSTVE